MIRMIFWALFATLMLAPSAHAETVTFSALERADGSLWFDFRELRGSQVLSADITISLGAEENFYTDFPTQLDGLHLVHYNQIPYEYYYENVSYLYDQYLYLNDIKIDYIADFDEESGSFNYYAGNNLTSFRIFDESFYVKKIIPEAR